MRLDDVAGFGHWDGEEVGRSSSMLNESGMEKAK